jgi:hypothetical protein
MVLAMLAALISVLGARQPGGGAWAILMALLVVVLLIPWLEESGRLRRVGGVASARLESPWTIFYGLLALTGVTNFLPTRFGLAALCVGIGLIGEYLGLVGAIRSPAALATLWTSVAWFLGLGSRIAAWCASRPLAGRNDLERLWLWFRDHWGVVWALRIEDRFNRTAEQARWPARLNWFGLVSVSPAGPRALPDLPEQAQTTLRNLIRRFATPERVDRALDTSSDGSCHSVEGEG